MKLAVKRKAVFPGFSESSMTDCPLLRKRLLLRVVCLHPNISTAISPGNPVFSAIGVVGIDMSPSWSPAGVSEHREVIGS
jgi:hypothetical protein